jgi:hypothetical protein
MFTTITWTLKIGPIVSAVKILKLKRTSFMRELEKNRNIKKCLII